MTLSAPLSMTTATTSMMMIEEEEAVHRVLETVLSPFEQLCDDELALILLYCDFGSAVRWALTTSRALRRRLYQDVSASHQSEEHPLAHAWKSIHHRHGFSSFSSSTTAVATTTTLPNESSLTGVDYVEHCRRGRQIDQNLFQYRRRRRQLPQHSSKTSSCFNLPHRHFHFVPILPPPTYRIGWNEADPPPVDFDCHSFHFTNMGRSGEYVLLNPLDDSLTLCRLTYASTMAATLSPANNAINNNSNDTPPKSCSKMTSIATRLLLSYASNYDFDWRANIIFDARGTHRNHDDNVMWSLGVDARPILEVDAHHPFYYHQIGTMICYGRTHFTEIPIFAAQADTASRGYCTELIAWRWRNHEPGNNQCAPHATTMVSSSSSPPVAEQWICQFRYGFRALDICAMTNRIYLSFLSGDGPTNLENGQPINSHNPTSRWVAAFPFVRLDKGEGDHLDCTPDPIFVVECQHDVATVTIDPSGTILLVGTVERTLEIWKIVDGCVDDPQSPGWFQQRLGTKAKRMHILNVPACIQKMASAASRRQRAMAADSNDVNMVPPEAHQQEEPQVDQRLPIPHPEPLDDVFHPQHLSLATSGFVTLQHSRTDGSTLLVWMSTDHRDDNATFDVVSQIQLPLSPQCKPSIHYDGRRLIAFGKDHIGVIILVYHVLTSLETIGESVTSAPPSPPTRGGGDESAGISNWTTHPRVRFINRIRHVALGGLGSLDSLIMTCNERYIMVNTKSGHLWNNYNPSQDPPGNSIFAADGLLVIDLEEASYER